MSRHGSGKRRRASPDPDDTGAPRPDAAADPTSGPVEDAYDAGSPGSGEYDVSSYGSGEYAAYGAETYAQADYAQADYESTQYPPTEYEPAEYESGGYPARPVPGEPEAYPSQAHSAAGYGASAYDPATDPALMGGTAEFVAVDEPVEATERRPTERRPDEAREADTGMRPAPPPHEGNIIRLVAVGSLIWFALFLVAWLMRDTLSDDRDWWPWCALAGSGLGLFGLWYCRRLQSADED